MDHVGSVGRAGGAELPRSPVGLEGPWWTSGLHVEGRFSQAPCRALDGAEFTFWGRPVDLVAGGAGDSYQPESGHLTVHRAQILFQDIPPLVFLTC